MTKNYYAVTVKLGHVGKTKCIIKTVPTVAENGRKAAEAARKMPRVKHHDKNAIISVKKITQEQYQLLKEKHNNDSFFLCENVQQQRRECIGIYDEVQSMKKEIDLEKRKIERKMRTSFKQKKYKAKLDDYKFSKNNHYELYSY